MSTIDELQYCRDKLQSSRELVGEQEERLRQLAVDLAAVTAERDRLKAAADLPSVALAVLAQLEPIFADRRTYWINADNLAALSNLVPRLRAALSPATDPKDDRT